VEVIFEKGDLSNSKALFEKVDKIHATGSTNLYAGVEKAIEVLKQHRVKDSSRVQRIFLFSDGLVNQGVTDKGKILKMTKSDIHDEQDVQVSAFGLGDDFDEELMKGIAENGSGTYFFIEGSDAIPTFTNFALKGLLKLAASDAVLNVRGLNGGVVTKIYGQTGSIAKGKQLDDLTQNNTRKAICTVQITPSKGVDAEEILHYELSYRPATGEDTRLSISGVVNMTYTTDSEVVKASRNIEVFIEEVIQQTADIDSELVVLMDQSKLTEAIALQEKQIALFRSVLELDSDKVYNVAALLSQAEAALKDLEDHGVSKESRKKAHHRGYMKRRLSIGYTNTYVGLESD